MGTSYRPVSPSLMDCNFLLPFPSMQSQGWIVGILAKYGAFPVWQAERAPCIGGAWDEEGYASILAALVRNRQSVKSLHAPEV